MGKACCLPSELASRNLTTAGTVGQLHANMRTLKIYDPTKESVGNLKYELATLVFLMLEQKGKRGRQKGAFVGELNHWISWYEICTRHLRERMGMATKKNERVEWRGFIECKLTEAEKELFAQWDVHDHDLFLLLSEAVCAGLKLSVTFNKQNDHFVASLTGGAEAGKAEGWTLSAFAPNWYEAVRAVLFKHNVLLVGDWSLSHERPTEGIG